jgi:hypothetical protein
VPKLVFHIFNWTFISFIQSILLFLLATPVYPILLSTQFDPEIQASDIGFAALEIGLVVFEIFADQQQWSKTRLELNPSYETDVYTLQTTRTQRKNIRRQPKSRMATSRQTLTGDSSRQACGGSADTLTLPPSRVSGCSSINGAAMPPSRCTIGPQWPHCSWFSCSSHRRC